MNKKNIKSKRGIKRKKPEKSTKKPTPANKKQCKNQPTSAITQVFEFYNTYILNILYIIYIYKTL